MLQTLLQLLTNTVVHKIGDRLPLLRPGSCKWSAPSLHIFMVSKDITTSKAPWVGFVLFVCFLKNLIY